MNSEEMATDWQKLDRLCGLVARVPGYRSRGPGSIPGTVCGLVVRVPGYTSRGPGSIPSTIRFSE
jgi:hypothetical protein